MPVYSTTENFLDKYRTLNSWNRYHSGSIPNLSTYRFESNPELAHEVLSKAGPTHVYHAPGYMNEVSNVTKITTEVSHEPSSCHSHTVHYKINEDCDPVRMVRPVNPVTQRQNIRIRYLEPPLPPTPPPIIIKERQLTPPPPAPPIVVRQIAPPPPTPPPLVIREKPPTPPCIPPPAVIEKVIPPPSPPPRQVIIERIPAPEKPREIIYEKWLPYKPVPERKVVVERGKMYEKQPAPKNVIIEYEKPKVEVDKQVCEEGVIRADPNCYMQTRPCGDLTVVDKIRDLPGPSSSACYQPSWSGQRQRSLTPGNIINATMINNNNSSTRSKTSMDTVESSSAPKGPTGFNHPWNTTYRTSYTGRGFNRI